jgi:membrane associated rhomboid family serine protease
MILMPVAVDVPMQRYPIANWVIMALTSIYSLVLIVGDDTSGVASLAHLGGFAIGFAATIAAVFSGRFAPARYEKNLLQVAGIHEYDTRPMPIGFRD